MERHLKATAPHRAQVPAMNEARRAFAGGDLATAERICSEVLARTPDDGTAWALLTETALQRGRPDAAIVCANRAAALIPKDPIALVLRAKCLFVSGEARGAFDAAEAASKINDDAPETLDALGAIFGLLGLHQRAKQFFLRADLRSQSADRNHIEEMEALIRDRKLAWPSEVMLRFALGKEYEDLDVHDRAFDHVDAGCELQHRSIAHDHAAEIAEIDQIIHTHTRSWIGAAPPGYSAAAPVFVAGLPRTGTTLVERIIASHSAMSSVGETGAFAAEMSRTVKASPTSGDLAGIGRRYVDSATAFRDLKNPRFVDKTLQNYLYFGLIHAALPAARIVLVQRHPMDACWAIYKAHFQGKFAFSYHQIELAEYYLAYRRLSRHWRATLPPDVLLEINYEDIVRDQAAAGLRLLYFVGLPWDDEVLRFHESPAPSATASAVQVGRPIYSSSVGKWRHHAERLPPLRARLAREIPEAELM